MRKRAKQICWPVVSILCAFLMASIGAAAQAPAQPAASTPAKDVVNNWNEIGRKLIAMAEDFPEDKYDWKPTPEIRTFAEQLLHAAGATYYFEALSNGQRPKEEDPRRTDFKSKAEIVAYVKKAVADGAKLIQDAGDAGLMKSVTLGRRSVTLLGLWADATEHNGEHYGQLVLYYRLNKMVPPESRPRK